MHYVVILIVILLISIVFSPYWIPLYLFIGTIRYSFKFGKFKNDFFDTYNRFIEEVKQKRVNDFWLNEKEISSFEELSNQYKVLTDKIKDQHDSAQRNNISLNQDGSYSNRSNKGKEINKLLYELYYEKKNIEEKINFLKLVPYENWKKYKTKVEEFYNNYENFYKNKSIKKGFIISLLIWLLVFSITIFIYLNYFESIPEYIEVLNKKIDKKYYLFWIPPFLPLLLSYILRRLDNKKPEKYFPQTPPDVNTINLYSYSYSKSEGNTIKSDSIVWSKKEIETRLFSIYSIMVLNGCVNQDEMRLFIKKAISFGYDKNDFNNFIRDYDSGVINVKTITLPKNKEKQMKIIGDLLSMIMIDGEVSEKEVEFSRCFIQLFGIPVEIIDKTFFDVNNQINIYGKDKIISTIMNNI